MQQLEQLLRESRARGCVPLACAPLALPVPHTHARTHPSPVPLKTPPPPPPAPHLRSLMEWASATSPVEVCEFLESWHAPNAMFTRARAGVRVALARSSEARTPEQLEAIQRAVFTAHEAAAELAAGGLWRGTVRAEVRGMLAWGDMLQRALDRSPGSLVLRPGGADPCSFQLAPMEITMFGLLDSQLPPGVAIASALVASKSVCGIVGILTSCLPCRWQFISLAMTCSTSSHANLP